MQEDDFFYHGGQMSRRVLLHSILSGGILLAAILAAGNGAGCKGPPGQKSALPAASAGTTRPAVARAGPASLPTTEPSFAFTHIVTADTAILMRGASDADVNYDTISAGTHVRAIGTSDAFLRVLTADGRDGLVARERLAAVAPAPATQAAAVAANPGRRRGNAPPPPPLNEYASFWPGNPPAADCPTDEEINLAINRAVAFIKSRSVNGTWDPPGGNPPAMAQTALVLAAIGSTGESVAGADLNNAVKLVYGNAPADTFSSAMRTENWNVFSAGKRQGVPGERDLAELAKQRQTAAFGAKLDDRQADNVSTYYAFVGLKNLQRDGIVAPDSAWAGAEKSIRAAQSPPGHWLVGLGGSANAAATFTSTAAGYLALRMAWDAHFVVENECWGNAADPALNSAITLLDETLKNPPPSATPCESACWVERVGDASGRKYLGGRDWFSHYARTLLALQRDDGSWNNDVRETAFAILFFKRGNAPIRINKLAWSAIGSKPFWNERPGDIAHFTGWLDSDMLCELPGNWQVVEARAPIDDWLEAPILYIGGYREADLQPRLDKLRAFVEGGGTIIANADCGGAGFYLSWRRLTRQMFPKYELRQLPADHPIFTNEMFLAKKWKTQPRVDAISNSVRELMFIIPKADVSRAWQVNNPNVDREPFQLGANLYMYATGKSIDWPTKAQRRQKPAEPLGANAPVVRVARLMVGENWDPEPGAWRQMSNVVARDLKAKLEVDEIVPGNAKLKDYAIVHLTGTTKFTFTGPARDEIKAFVDNGGTLLIDAAGGSPKFADAAADELKAIFGNDANELAEPTDAAILFAPKTGLKPIGPIVFTTSARMAMAHRGRDPSLRVLRRNGRLAVFFSREDLTAGMAGVCADRIVGYSPASATAIVSDIVRYVAPR
ncbi:MAG TPA: DUF4159 domain-containing protein [Tepidisphaeraceae bacterium]|nr:DUF4159 domain-containing protein [Tepidisphaeraceae bacterium]